MIDAVPASLAPDVAESARSTLAGAVAAAEHLPGSLSAELIADARLAFAHAFDVTAVVTATVVLVTAALVAIVLRDRSSEQVLAPATVSCQ